MLPTGPMKLSRATGAPIVPIFSIRMPGGKLRVAIEPALHGESKTGGVGDDPVLGEWAGLLERYVKRHPSQWLMLQPAVEEDKATGDKETRRSTETVPPCPPASCPPATCPPVTK
jgi:KDO2-lipid IV(A) lauroyltransferase